MQLGQFSVSLTVKNIHRSLAFYQKLGFRKIDGSTEHKWLILQQGETKIGLYQDMFPKNILTFNPVKQDMDIRDIQKKLKTQNIDLIKETDAEQHGSGYISFCDPDGNHILIDQA